MGGEKHILDARPHCLHVLCAVVSLGEVEKYGNAQARLTYNFARARALGKFLKRVWVRDRDKKPRLIIQPAWRPSATFQDIFQNLPRDWLLCELANACPTFDNIRG